MAKKRSKRSPVDRRRHPREFFIAGWDPYIVSLKERDKAEQPDEEEEEDEPTSSRRASLLKQKRD